MPIKKLGEFYKLFLSNILSITLIDLITCLSFGRLLNSQNDCNVDLIHVTNSSFSGKDNNYGSV